jgi:hypothetical protein
MNTVALWCLAGIDGLLSKCFLSKIGWAAPFLVLGIY